MQHEAEQENPRLRGASESAVFFLHSSPVPELAVKAKMHAIFTILGRYRLERR